MDSQVHWSKFYPLQRFLFPRPFKERFNATDFHFRLVIAYHIAPSRGQVHFFFLSHPVTGTFHEAIDKG